MAKILYTDSDKNTINADDFKLGFDDRTNSGADADSIIVDTTWKDNSFSGSNKTTNGLFYVDSTLDSSSTGFSDLSAWPINVPVYIDHWDYTQSGDVPPGIYIKTGSGQPFPQLISANDVDYDVTDLVTPTGAPIGLDGYKALYNPGTNQLILHYVANIPSGSYRSLSWKVTGSAWNMRRSSTRSGAMIPYRYSSSLRVYSFTLGYYRGNGDIRMYPYAANMTANGSPGDYTYTLTAKVVNTVSTAYNNCGFTVIIQLV